MGCSHARASPPVRRTPAPSDRPLESLSLSRHESQSSAYKKLKTACGREVDVLVRPVVAVASTARTRLRRDAQSRARATRDPRSRRAARGARAAAPRHDRYM